MRPGGARRRAGAAGRARGAGRAGSRGERCRRPRPPAALRVGTAVICQPPAAPAAQRERSAGCWSVAGLEDEFGAARVGHGEPPAPPLPLEMAVGCGEISTTNAGQPSTTLVRVSHHQPQTEEKRTKQAQALKHRAGAALGAEVARSGSHSSSGPEKGRGLPRKNELVKMVFGQDSGQKKEKRKGPCLWCGERESTQWRIGPSHAPTLCNGAPAVDLKPTIGWLHASCPRSCREPSLASDNARRLCCVAACGVHWGRKKKLPAHRVPYGNAARLKRERQIFTYVEESDSSESESQAAETLLQLSLSPSSTREKRRQSTAAARRCGRPSRRISLLYSIGRAERARQRRVSSRARGLISLLDERWPGGCHCAFPRRSRDLAEMRRRSSRLVGFDRSEIRPCALSSHFSFSTSASSAAPRGSHAPRAELFESLKV